jgi:hypothetical protein
MTAAVAALDVAMRFSRLHLTSCAARRRLTLLKKARPLLVALDDFFQTEGFRRGDEPRRKLRELLRAIDREVVQSVVRATQLANQPQQSSQGKPPKPQGPPNHEIREGQQPPKKR